MERETLVGRFLGYWQDPFAPTGRSLVWRARHLAAAVLFAVGWVAWSDRVQDWRQG